MRMTPAEFVRYRRRRQLSGRGRATPVLTTIVVSPPVATFTEGETQQFTASGLDQYGDPIATGSIAWDTSDHSKATIDAAGVATGIAAGECDVTATAGIIVSAVATVTVEPPPFDPRTLPGVWSWHEAETLTATLANNAQVGDWTDETGQGHHLHSDAINVDTAILKHGILNGRAVVHAKGVKMRIAAALASGAKTFVILARYAVPSGQYLFDFNLGSAGLYSSGNILTFRKSQDDVPKSTGVSTSQWSTIVIQIISAASMKIRINGADVVTTDPAAEALAVDRITCLFGNADAGDGGNNTAECAVFGTFVADIGTPTIVQVENDIVTRYAHY